MGSVDSKNTSFPVSEHDHQRPLNKSLADANEGNPKCHEKSSNLGRPFEPRYSFSNLILSGNFNGGQTFIFLIAFGFVEFLSQKIHLLVHILICRG